MDETFDCIVAVAGFIVVSSAIWFQREGLRVAVIDPNEPGSGASYGNAGCFNASSIVPMSMPGMLKSVPGWLLDPMGPLSIPKSYLPSILPWLWKFLWAGRPGNVKLQAKALRSILEPSLPYLMQLVGPAKLLELVEARGHLYVYRSAASLASDQFGWSLRRENGVRFEELTQARLREFDPNLSPDYERGIFLPDNGHTINPGRLVKSLADHFASQGGTVIRGKVTGFEIENGALRSVVTDGGQVRTRSCVVSAGAYSGRLTQLLGDTIPLETERGYHVVIKSSEVTPRVPTTDATGKFVATPMEAGLRLAGTVELGGLSAPPSWKRARRLLEHGRRMFPNMPKAFEEERLDFWMGHRPSLPDSLPVVCRSRHCRDVIYAFGHGHVGMTAAPFTGKIVSDMVQGRLPPVDLKPFRADRF